MTPRPNLRTWFALVAILALIVGCTGRTSGGGAAAPTGTLEPEKQRVTLTMGGSASTSSVFAYLTAHARLSARADGAMTINVRETNASTENFQLIAAKGIDFGIAIVDTALEALKGEGAFKDKAVPQLRMLLVDRNTAHLILVRSDKGINTVYDLQGKSFAPSFQGSGVYTTVKNMLNTLGVVPQEFKGNLEDLANAVKDGRIVGYGKSGSGKKADASMLDVAANTPVKVIGFTDADAEKIRAKYPTYLFDTIAAGTLNNPAPFKTVTAYAGYFVSADMPEDVAYRLTKSLYSTIEAAANEANNESARGRTSSESVQASELVPLHPGAARYFKEIGAMK